MLRQHLVRQNIANENSNENQDIISKKYYIRQNISINKQNPLLDSQNASNSLMTTSKPLYQNQIKLLDHLKEPSQQETQDSSLETSFNCQNKNSQNRFFLKLLIPSNCSKNTSPKSISKFDQLNSNDIFNGKQFDHSKNQSSPKSQNFLKKRECQKAQNSTQQIDSLNHKQKEIRKHKSKSFLNLKQINCSLQNENSQKNLKIEKQTEQQINDLSVMKKRNYQIDVSFNQQKKQYNSSYMPPISNSPSYSMSPCRIQRLNSYSKDLFSNTPTSIINRQLIDFQEKNEIMPNTSITKEKRRSSLNLTQTQDSEQIQLNSHPKLSNKKESRVASLTRLQDEDKSKFIQEAQKMYVEKRIIADEEDLRVVTKMNLDENEYQHVDNIIQYQKNSKTHQILQDLYKKSQQNISKQQSFSNDKNANVQNVLQNKVCKRHFSVIGIKNPETLIQNHYKAKKSIQFNLQQLENITKIDQKTADKVIQPRKLSLIQINKTQNDLNSSNTDGKQSSIQTNLIEPLSSFPKKNQIQPFQLKQSRINQSIYQILEQSAPDQTLELNLSKIELNQEILSFFQSKFLTQNARLQILNLENCKIRDQMANQLLESLVDNSSIKKLNLSQNLLTSKSCQNIKKLLSQNYYLEELYLYWNLIKGDGATLIAQGLQVNTTLNVLDLSKNPLGKIILECSGGTNGQSCCEEIKKFLMFQQSNLVHLDFSNCDFNHQESLVIQQGLQFNHNIYGFHFTGNVGTVDALGFLNVNDHLNSFRNIHLNHRIDGVKAQNLMFTKDRSLVSVDNCWICEGWEEQEIILDINKFNSMNEIIRIFVHLDFFEYKGILMQVKQNNNNTYSAKIMCPPNQTVKFFFTIPEQKTSLISPEYQIQSLEQKISSILQYQDDQSTIIDINQNINSVNILKTKVGKVIDEDSFHPLIECYPRHSFKSQQNKTSKQSNKARQIPIQQRDKRKQIMYQLLNNSINFNKKVAANHTYINTSNINISKNQISN